MKFPAIPPDTGKILAATAKRSPAQGLALFLNKDITDNAGRYLHWDELRRHAPPADLTVEEWWAAIRIHRQAASQSLPLADQQNRPFGFCEPPILRAALCDLDMNAGGALDAGATSLTPSEGKQYLVRSLAEEPFASSFIEGAATTRLIAKKLIFDGRAPRTKDERMVLNNYRAMEFVKTRRDEPLSLDMLLELHRTVTEDTLDDPLDAGRIRTHDHVRVVDETDGEVLYQPPPAADLPARLERLIAFANDRPAKGKWIHPMIRAFVLHFMLSYEHPFVDGNGRVARALFYWSALREGYWLMAYVSISSVIAEAEIAYGKTFLHVETDGADLTYFLLYHADILQTALKNLAAFVERNRKEVEALDRRLSDTHRPDAFNHRQSWLLNEFVRGRLGATTIAEHCARHGVSYLTARHDLEALVAAGLARKVKIGKSSNYRPIGDLGKRLAASVE